MKKQGEFKIGQTVTLDRYNHIDDAVKVKVVGYGEMPVSGDLTYVMDVNGTKIDSNGISIKESKFYVPCPEEDRHHKIGISYIEKEKFWDKLLGRN